MNSIDLWIAGSIAATAATAALIMLLESRRFRHRRWAGIVVDVLGALWLFGLVMGVCVIVTSEGCLGGGTRTEARP